MNRIALALVLSLFAWVATAAAQEPRHGIAMHGEPALPAGFEHLPYVNPSAPRGGGLGLAIQGTFDSLNPLILLGAAPDASIRYVLQSLLMRSLDEPFSLYGLVARSVEMPDDRSTVTFNLDPRARFSDGRPLTAEDVRVSFELLRAHGKIHRRAFVTVKAVEVLGPHRIRFDLTGADDRELPLIIGLMPIFPAHLTDPERFDKTSLTPIVGSGPYVMSEIRPGERIVLTRNPDFWAKDLPVLRGVFNFDEIRYDFYRDANTLFEAFKAGLYDFRLEGDPTRWATGYDFPALRDGRIKQETVPIRTPKGMNGFVFNLRRPVFSDVRVREALGLLFDFEWVNRNLFSGLLRRSGSYFQDSPLSALGRPADEKERQLLSKFPGVVRADIMDGTWGPAATDGSGRDRDIAKRALSLLRDAGWELQGDVLRSRSTGEPFSFEFLVVNRQQERLALNYLQSLSRIGIKARLRLVDDVQYWRRLGTFDFDMIQWTWGASLSPGIEQRNRWANKEGSANYAGVQEPAAGAMIDAMLRATSREDFEAATRALDRVLLSGFYVVPLFHVGEQWLAYDAGLRRPPRIPLLGVSVDTWWREQ